MFYGTNDVDRPGYARYSESSTPTHSPRGSDRCRTNETSSGMDHWSSPRGIADEVPPILAGSFFNDAEMREMNRVIPAAMPLLVEATSVSWLDASPESYGGSTTAHHPPAGATSSSVGRCAAATPSIPSLAGSLLRKDVRLRGLQMDHRGSNHPVVSSSTASDRTMVDYGVSAECIPVQPPSHVNHEDIDVLSLWTSDHVAATRTHVQQRPCSLRTTPLRVDQKVGVSSSHNLPCKGLERVANLSGNFAVREVIVSRNSYGSLQTRSRSCPVTFCARTSSPAARVVQAPSPSKCMQDVPITFNGKSQAAVDPQKAGDALKQYRLAVENVKKKGYDRSIREILANPCVDDDEDEDEDDEEGVLDGCDVGVYELEEQEE
ncbi:hypothetical protein, conserved [Trypanosoma brucei gambiense DAL972]|uniref:Uncharacterized protein n=1 Tax=Trypanosoma brucei gambiense (strain MHOM/CI/86/DAL972) TaxID=679716 RepID=D0AA83_TRYB9|nr:hypothetical protein, conserved [Trypanosoma brucei gambiense DAL972]CBH18584.1 hypothetical protein, conserved [Trypanosoma brucei gambiense DAL972]|eukprot:XP_011780848.1 hypothetical protein, conserved [Trypanosoma brucei gambiense DAL972]